MQVRYLPFAFLGLFALSGCGGPPDDPLAGCYTREENAAADIRISLTESGYAAQLLRDGEWSESRVIARVSEEELAEGDKLFGKEASKLKAALSDETEGVALFYFDPLPDAGGEVAPSNYYFVLGTLFRGFIQKVDCG